MPDHEHRLPGMPVQHMMRERLRIVLGDHFGRDSQTLRQRRGGRAAAKRLRHIDAEMRLFKCVSPSARARDAARASPLCSAEDRRRRRESAVRGARE